MTLTHLGTQVLTTPRLRLRRFSVDDVDAMYANWASDPEVTAFLTWPAYTDKEPLREYVAQVVASYDSPASYHWIIELAADATPIGSLGVVDTDEAIDMVEVGYCIGRPWWNLGYTSEALGAVIAFLVDQVGANRVEAIHDPENVASGRVMAKCGMRHEGVLRSRQRSYRGIKDASMWAILADDRT
ncbi:MAG: GNAT family N-acetyltransferase [Propionibacteriaceae bacterium]|nr:GNAT family N-acetyltransferase [Propionibacteriaceae bacterium]